MAARRPAALAAALALAGCAHQPPPPPPVATIAPPVRPKPRPEQPQELPIELVGLNQADVKAILGAPADQTDQGTSQSWTYHAPHCTVALTFFFDVSRNGFFVLDRQVTGTNGSEKAAQRCLKQLRAARAVG